MTNAHYRDRIVDQIDRSLKIALFVRANERNVMHIQWERFANELLVELIISSRRDVRVKL